MKKAKTNKYEPQRLAISAWAEEDRPREKLMQKGSHSLSDAELLAILIRAGSPSMSAVDMAKHVLALADNDLNRLAKQTVHELMKTKGMGEAKALAIKAALELGKRRTPEDTSRQVPITSAQIAYNLMKPHLGDLVREEFWVLILNRRNVLLDKIQVSTGGVSGTVADPKIIFKAALDRVASAIILMHNHPSGNLKPSQADINLTKKVKDGATALDISLLDHIIFTDQHYYSFAEEGML
jgi:DNA repair protein RadC